MAAAKGILSNTNLPTRAKPFFFVFDLDDTIIRTADIGSNWWSALPETIKSHKVVPVWNLLGNIHALRESGKAKIFLFTNNSNEEYILKVDQALAKDYGTGASFFDRFLKLRDAGRDGDKKRLADVERMVRDSGLEDISNLAARTYFFDDMDDHVLADELDTSHYIVINPYAGGDFSALAGMLAAANQTGGGLGVVRRIRGKRAGGSHSPRRTRRAAKKVGTRRRRSKRSLTSQNAH